MNIPFVVETVLHDGLLKYKFKNSKIRSITTKPGKSKGAIFAYRSKKSMIGGRGVVLTSEEAIHENQDTFTHWTPNVYRYGTYADENRSYTKGHSENNLRQIKTCEYNMFEFNNRLDQPLEEKEVIKLVRSAYSENYQGANREYITILCKAWVSSDLTSKDLFVRQGWFKFKKKRSERQRVHLSEWKEDLMAYISEKSDVYKPYLVTTKKEIREALGIPERTLDKLLKVLKANQEIFFKIKPGRNGGIQLASVKSLLLSIIKVKKEEKESYIKALSEFFDLEHTFIQETLNKLAERPKTDTQLDLFSYDTG